MARIGRYDLLGRLATGGMAELFLARAEGIEGFRKIVVLKRILPGKSGDEEFVNMFLQEARLAGTLHHSNIVQVYDIGVEDGSYFFTMEFLRGRDLRDLARATFRNKKRIPLPIVVQIIAGIAAGLHYAHEKLDPDGNPLELVHRDVSPANVFVTWDGGVKLVDFGIAKAASAESTTRAGTLKGKVPYMSPEQCQGESLDRRSDIFALGTLLWEYSIGRRLWRGEHELMTIKKIANEPPIKPSSIYDDYPAELEKIVLKALANDREERYQTAQELQMALEDFARDNGWVMSSARLSHYLLETFPDQTTLDTVLTDLDPVLGDETRLDRPLRDSNEPSVSASFSVPGPVPRAWLLGGAVGGLGLVVIAGMMMRGSALLPRLSSLAGLAELSELADGDVPDALGEEPRRAPGMNSVESPTAGGTDVRTQDVVEDVLPSADLAAGDVAPLDPAVPRDVVPPEPRPETEPNKARTGSKAKKKTTKNKTKKHDKGKKKAGPVDPDALFPPD